MQEIKDLNLGNIFFINKNEIINQIDTNSLVGKYVVFKKYPSTIDIKIDKTFYHNILKFICEYSIQQIKSINKGIYLIELQTEIGIYKKKIILK